MARCDNAGRWEIVGLVQRKDGSDNMLKQKRSRPLSRPGIAVSKPIESSSSSKTTNDSKTTHGENLILESSNGENGLPRIESVCSAKNESLETVKVNNTTIPKVLQINKSPMISNNTILLNQRSSKIFGSPLKVITSMASTPTMVTNTKTKVLPYIPKSFNISNIRTQPNLLKLSTSAVALKNNQATSNITALPFKMNTTTTTKVTPYSFSSPKMPLLQNSLASVNNSSSSMAVRPTFTNLPMSTAVTVKPAQIFVPLNAKVASTTTTANEASRPMLLLANVKYLNPTTQPSSTGENRVQKNSQKDITKKCTAIYDSTEDPLHLPRNDSESIRKNSKNDSELIKNKYTSPKKSSSLLLPSANKAQNKSPEIKQVDFNNSNFYTTIDLSIRFNSVKIYWLKGAIKKDVLMNIYDQSMKFNSVVSLFGKNKTDKVTFYGKAKICELEDKTEIRTVILSANTDVLNNAIKLSTKELFRSNLCRYIVKDKETISSYSYDVKGNYLIKMATRTPNSKQTKNYCPGIKIPIKNLREIIYFSKEERNTTASVEEILLSDSEESQNKATEVEESDPLSITPIKPNNNSTCNTMQEEPSLSSTTTDFINDIIRSQTCKNNQGLSSSILNIPEEATTQESSNKKPKNVDESVTDKVIFENNSLDSCTKPSEDNEATNTSATSPTSSLELVLSSSDEESDLDSGEGNKKNDKIYTLK